jgi:GTP-binding protein
MSYPIRNIAIIAHVDHGKTTLVDGLLKQTQTFRANEAAMSQDLIMDSNAQERERGITILAKNTAVEYAGVKINIIDTPGHADFSGEVERTISMADGAILLVDAQEGPMPQTKFVLRKALELGLRPIVLVNKIDKRDARIDDVLNEVGDLFLELATDEAQLEYPVFYAIGRDGKAWDHVPADPSADATLEPIFKAIIDQVPAPQHTEGGLQIMVSALDWDTYKGIYAIGRVMRGEVKAGQQVVLLGGSEEQPRNARIDKLFVSKGLQREEATTAPTGEIVALTGFGTVRIGETIADPAHPEALPALTIAEPTLKMSIAANTSPFAGREGKFVTSRQLHDRIVRELQHNVSMRMEPGESGDFILSGRGELHLAVFIETLRREGFELQVGKPMVITKEVNGVQSEPIEELVIDVNPDYVGSVTGEVGRRKGLLLRQEENRDGTVRLEFEISTRGLLGLRNVLLTLSKGTAVMNSLFSRYEATGAPIPQMRNGALISSDTGTATSYGLNVAQGRGITYIPAQTEVYEGMIIGLNARDEDLEINVCKEKKLTNVRASGSDDAIVLTPPTLLSLEQCLDFLEDDELLEATPKTLRLRKRLLTQTERSKAKKRG